MKGNFGKSAVWFAAILIVFGCGNVLFGQNLLPNPSFEVNTGCPSTVAQVANATPWSTPAGHGGSADYLHTCGAVGWVGVPSNAFGNQPAFQGDAYIGFALYYQATPNFREYVMAPLTQTLIAGQQYEISTYYSLGDESTFATDKLQFYFSSAPTTWGSGGWGPMTTYVPQTAIPTGTFLSNKSAWTRISATYTAAGGEQYVTIGNYLDDASTPTIPAGSGAYTTCYIYLDSVVLRPLNPQSPTGAAPDTTLCPGACYQLYAFGDSNYTWTTTTNPVPFSTSDSVVVCPTVTTSYVVTTGTWADTVTVTVLPSLPNVNLGPDTTICQGQSVTLDPALVGYDYLWSPGGAVTQTINVSTSGTYQVVVSDACAADSDAVQVTVVPLPAPNLGADTSLCAGNGLLLSAPGGMASYSWSTSATTASIFVNTTGTYSVTVTSPAGCVGSDAINVTVAAPLGLLMNHTNVTCNGGSDGTATAIGSGTAPLSYVWSLPGSPTTPTVGGLAAGSYSVTVTDGVGCTRSATVLIEEPDPIGLALSATGERCPGSNDGLAYVVVSGGTPPYTIVWDNGDTGVQADSLAPGNHLVTVTDADGCSTTGTVGVAAAAPITASTQGNPSFCAGAGGDTLNVTVTGGAQPYYYTWWCHPSLNFCGLDSVNDDDPVANPDTSGWYYVQITDGSGCHSNIDSIWIEVLPLPVVDAGPDLILCGDNAPCQILNPTISGAPGPFTYQWMPGTALNDSTIANPCARPDTTTIYALVVTGGNGCASAYSTTDTLATVTVHVNPIPVAHAGMDRDICLGDTVILQGFGTDAGPAYQYQWTPSNGLSSTTSPNPAASPAISTHFTLVVWSNGCPSYGDSVYVAVHTLPTTDAGPDREICWGDTVLLDAQASGDSSATYTYLWTPGTTISNATDEDPRVWPGGTTMYYVEASSSWGCGSARDSVLVTLLPSPVADAGPDLTICGHDSLQLQSAYGYATADTAPSPTQVYFSWIPADSMNDSTLLQPTVWPGQSTMYYLEVRYNTCVTTDSMILTVVPALVASYGADTSVICGGDSVQLFASGGLGGAAFQWSPAAGLSDPNSPNPLAAPDSTTTYHLTATEGGCIAEGDVTIAVIPSAQAAFLNSLPDGCPPHAVNFVQTSDHTIAYVWNFGDGSPVSNMPSPTHTYDAPGTYEVTLLAVGQGECNDSAQALTVTVYDTAVVAFTSDPEYPALLSIPNTSVDFINLTQGGTSYVWEFGDGVNSDALNPTHVYTGEGSYFVTLTATNALGCQSSVTHGPYVVAPSDLFIPNVFTPNEDGIGDEFLVNYTGTQPFNLVIVDRWGVQLYGGTNKNKGWDGNDAKGQAAPEGVYYFHLRIGKREYAGPVTLMR